MRKTARGYLMAEAMVSGSLLAITIAGTLSLIASHGADATYASQKTIASGLARAKADELASQKSCAGSQATFIAVGATHPAFQWRFTGVAAPNLASSDPPLPAGSLCEVEVSVRFPSRKSSRDDLVDGTADGKGLVTMKRLYRP